MKGSGAKAVVDPGMPPGVEREEAAMWVALFVMLGLGAALLRIVPPPATRQRRSAESSFWRSTSWTERKRLAALAKQLPNDAGTFASLELRQLQAASAAELVRPVFVGKATQGPRDLCLVDLPDGRTLRLTVFDNRNAARFVRSWSPDADLGLRLRWLEGIGWQCSLLIGVGPRATTVASVYAWLAEIDRSHQAVRR